jgi:4-hydroxybenzoate polyprenyltransferase
LYLFCSLNPIFLSSSVSCLFAMASEKTSLVNGNGNANGSVKSTPKEPPIKGFLSILPTSWVPYAQLMRLDRPAGFIGFYMPSILGIFYAAAIAEEVLPPVELLKQCIFFYVVNVLIRGAACTWNDNIDQELDRQVARCRNRPIARGAVSTTQGHIFALAQTAVLAAMLRGLPFECVYYSVAIGALYVLYPFCKRFTHYPQAILGVPLALAIILSCYTLRVDPLTPRSAGTTACLCVANIMWTMIYDTVYAHQDIQDDVKAGVKSMAVRFKDSTKQLATILAVCQIGLLVAAGVLHEMSTVYFVVGCSGSAVSVAAMIYFVDLSVPASCARWFKLGFCFVGGSMAGGFLGQYLERLLW